MLYLNRSLIDDSTVTEKTLYRVMYNNNNNTNNNNNNNYYY